MKFKKTSALKIEVGIALLIVVALLIPYLHVFLPDEKTYRIWFFDIVSNFQENIQTSYYLITVKLAYLTLYSIWFITCSEWWRYAILPQIIYCLYSLLGILNDDIFMVSREDLIVLIWITALSYIMIIILASVYLKLDTLFLLKSSKLSVNNLDRITKLSVKKYKFDLEHVDKLRELKYGMNSKEYLKNIVKKSKDLLIEHENYTTNLKVSNSRKLNIIYFVSLIALIPISFAFSIFPYTLIKTLSEYILYTLIHVKFSVVDVTAILWLFLTKLSLLVSLHIWFFSCKHWWKHAILVPISILLFQIMEMLNLNYNSRFDQYEIGKSMLIIVPVLLLLIWLSGKLKLFVLTYDLQNSLENEINEITLDLSRNSGIAKDMKEALDNLLRNKHQYTEADYLNQLRLIKEKIKQ